MTNKEKEKFLFSILKKISREQKWKFKRNFIFKKQEDIFFDCKFYINGANHKIAGYLKYKPYSVDNTFWHFTDLPDNSNMPLSFRSEAAFMVSGYNIFNFAISIKNMDNPEKEIQVLLNEINNKVDAIIKKKIDVKHFLKTLEKEDKNYVGIIICLMELKQYDKALEKIESYKERGANSGYRFGTTCFFDLMEQKCKTLIEGHISK